MNSSLKKIFYITLGCAVVFVAALVFAAKFALQMVQDSYVELSSLYDSKENYQQAKQYLEDVSQEAVLAEATLQEINKSFVEKNKEVDFIINLEGIADKTANMIDISIGSLPKEKQEANALVFNIDLAGSFPSLMRFLDEMDSLPYFTDIISLNTSRIDKTISSGGEAKQDNIEGNVKTHLIIKTYTK